MTAANNKLLTTYYQQNMLKNYFKIAIRNLAKSRVYTAINFLGLSVGVLCAIYISLYIVDELSYDTYHKNADRIYRVAGKYDQGGGDFNETAVTTFLLGPELEVEYPQVKRAVRIDPNYNQVVKVGDELYREQDIMYADSGFFDTFSFRILEGKKTSVLSGSSVAVISQPLADKYFGNETVIGQTIEISEIPVEVVAVMEQMPRNTHFHSNLVVSMNTIENRYADWVRSDWSGTSHYTYLHLEEHADPVRLESQINATWDQYISDLAESHDFFLQSLGSIHLKSHLSSEIEANGNITNVYIFGLVGIIILIMAGVNYMNLATVRSIERAREVGVRKVLGAAGLQIRLQFFADAILTSFAAVLIGLLLAELFIPVINDITGKAYAIDWNDGIYWIFGLTSLGLVIGIGSGFYPALLLSRFQVSDTLRNEGTGMLSGSTMRKLMVTIQFAASIGILISTAVIFRQLQYMKGKNLGINPSELVVVPFQTDDVQQQYEAFKDRLLANTSIVDVSATNNFPAGRVSHWREYEIEGETESVVVPTMIVTHDFFETLEAEFREGRPFSEEFTSDGTNAYIINESAARFLGLKDPLGTKIEGRIFTGREWNSKHAQIIGVVKDFHLSSLQDEIQPTIFSLSTEKTYPLSYMVVRLNSDRISEAIEHMRGVWNNFTSAYPFDFTFMDRQIQQRYENEERFLSMFGALTSIAILIACIGVLGLAAFTATRRKKEIGIRKVLGASESKIIWLLSKEYAGLIVLANFIAWPAAWWFTRNWLQNYAYHITPGIPEFLGMGLLVMVIILAAVGYQGMKAANMNPVKSLRSE